MKSLILAIFSLTILSSTVMAGTYEARQNLLQAQRLIDSALSQLDEEQDLIATRSVPGAQYICRSTATTLEVTEAAKSASQEVSARCDSRCKVIMEFRVTKNGCDVIAKGIR